MGGLAVILFLLPSFSSHLAVQPFSLLKPTCLWGVRWWILTWEQPRQGLRFGKEGRVKEGLATVTKLPRLGRWLRGASSLPSPASRSLLLPMLGRGGAPQVGHRAWGIKPEPSPTLHFSSLHRFSISLWALGLC